MEGFRVPESYPELPFFFFLYFSLPANIFYLYFNNFFSEYLHLKFLGPNLGTLFCIVVQVNAKLCHSADSRKPGGFTLYLCSEVLKHQGDLSQGHSQCSKLCTA